MVGRIFTPLLGAAFVAIPFAMPSPSGAQCRLCETPTTAPGKLDDGGQPLRLEIRRNLDFDRLMLLWPGAGSAQLGADGTGRAQGAFAAVSGRASVAEIVIRGEPGRAIRVDLPRAIQLYGLKGGTIQIDSIVSDAPAHPVLDGSGELKIRIGGELKVSGDVDGDFRGDVPVIVDYL